MVSIRRLLLLLGVLLIVLYELPCAWATIRIGAAVSLTGKYEKPGTMIYYGYRLWERQVNARRGLLGQKVRLIIHDDESSAEKSVRWYRQLIEKEKVDLVLSPYSSSITYRVSTVTEQYHYPLLASGASDPEIWHRGYRYVFGMYALASRYFTGFLDIIAEYGLKNVVTIAENDRFPVSAAKGVEKWSGIFGLKILKTVLYPKGNPDFLTMVKNTKILAPDAVVLCAYPGDVYKFMKAMKALRFRPRAFAATIAPTFREFGARLGQDAEGVFAPSQWEANRRIPFPGTRKFISDFEKFTNLTPTYHAASAYAACEILETAVKEAGSIDREKIASEIRKMDTFTVLGRFQVDDRGIQVGHNPIIIQWQKGKREIVWPRKMQTANPIFPLWHKQE